MAGHYFTTLGNLPEFNPPWQGPLMPEGYNPNDFTVRVETKALHPFWIFAGIVALLAIVGKKRR